MAMKYHVCSTNGHQLIVVSPIIWHLPYVHVEVIGARNNILKNE